MRVEGVFVDKDVLTTCWGWASGSSYSVPQSVKAMGAEGCTFYKKSILKNNKGLGVGVGVGAAASSINPPVVVFKFVVGE